MCVCVLLSEFSSNMDLAAPVLSTFLGVGARYAPKDSKKGGILAKGAAPSKDLVRGGDLEKVEPSEINGKVVGSS